MAQQEETIEILEKALDQERTNLIRLTHLTELAEIKANQLARDRDRQRGTVRKMEERLADLKFAEEHEALKAIVRDLKAELARRDDEAA